MPSLTSVLQFLETLAPLHLAADWDNVGLLLGLCAAEVQRIMTCLTVTPVSAAEAIAGRAHLLVTHHPILFRGVKRLTDATPEGRMLLDLSRAGIAVYSPHTAFDNAKDGINEILAARLGLQELTPLRARALGRQSKVVAFVPDSDLARVSNAMFAAGAGNIGQYSQCSFRLPGTGTFFGSDATNPTLGQKGRREEVSEWRLEAVCPESLIGEVIAAIRRAHSYEEPAYDVYPLVPQFAGAGEGRIGSLPKSVALGDLAQTIKTKLNARQMLLVGDSSRIVQRVALVCGAGGEFLADALRARAEVFLTGELRFHDYLSAQAEGMSLLLPGHYATERCGIEELAIRLQKQWPDLHVWASVHEQDPVDWV
ncbi:MAG TPA: Nif3-like dinuclear metal center hexameric protein [Gemmataceae bacterium]|nr:Nif3-like dinuclear metal center hexameric protein [Gemmataceae bacterium]